MGFLRDIHLPKCGLAGIVFAGCVGAQVAERSADVVCQQGNCFVRRKTSAWIDPLRLGQRTSLMVGDSVITVGSGSKVEVNFEDGSRSTLLDSGLLRIKSGRREVIMGEGEGAVPNAKNNSLLKKSNLAYVGSFPLRILTPSLGVPLLFQTFPQTVRVVLEPLDEAGLTKVQTSLSKWKVLRFDGKGFSPPTEVEFKKVTEQSKQFVADLEALGPGEYYFVPPGEVVERGKGLRFQVLGADSLEGQLKDLLKNSNEDPNAGIELRGK